MAFIGGIILVLGYLYFIKVFKIIAKSKKVIDLAKTSINVIKNQDLDDHIKEKSLQNNSITLFKLFFLITAGNIIALVVPFVIIWFMQLVNLTTIEHVLDVTFSLRFILLTTVIFLGFIWLVKNKNES